jgi:alpha-L-rhamnosidase
VRAVELRCEYRANPIGIDVTQPRLNWIVEAARPEARGLAQSAYRILVATSASALAADKGDLWDSGKVSSDQSAQVVYRGKPLASGAAAFWKVRIWDQAGRPSAWSRTAAWSMGLLRPEDWHGQWIGLDETGVYRRPGSPYHNLEKAQWIWTDSGTAAGDRFFRASFTLPAGRRLVRAVCVMGADRRFELFVNGSLAGKGSNVHAPEVLDISADLRPGQNLLAVRAANGGTGKPAGLIGAVRVEFTQGEPLLFTTGDRWKAADRAASDWEKPAFHDSAWASAKLLGGLGIAPWGEVGFAEENALPARLLRKEFDTPRKVVRATAYVAGLGLFELYLNGVKIGDQVLSPGLTDYDKRVQYVTFDVTSRIAAGRNAIGLLLGNGRYRAPRGGTPIGTRTYGNPKALAQLRLEYADGSSSEVVTDAGWKLSTQGPIRANNEYDGEEFDARLDQPGWSRPRFQDAQWQQAQLVKPPSGRLVAQMAEPLRVVETLHPVSVKRLRPGVWIFDMGQNMVGWCRLKVSGPAGTQVTLRHAETLRPDGELYVENLRSAQATDLYTLKGGAAETWEPRFTYHGFRYVEVSGFPGEPTAASLEGRVVHDAMTRVADFTSSNALLNQLHKNIFWGVRGNYRSIPTDCPQRDERQGWLGDRSTVSRSESYLFDVAAFYNKWMNDLEDSQRPNGSIPDVSPAYWVLYNDDVTWPSTFLLVPSMLYDQYGDLRVIERHYPAFQKWIEHMNGFLKDGLMTKDTYGDWCVPPESPQLIHSQDPARKTNGVLLATAYYYRMLRLMSHYATLLGKTSDAGSYDRLADTLRSAFLRRFFQASIHQFDNGTQTSAILPLAFGLEPEGTRQAVFDHLVGKIHNESKDHVGVGLIGAQWLMRTLSDNGRADLAYRIATQTSYPGWGYMIEKGATTIWELWNGDTADPAMNSGNHVMQIGDLGVWLYEYLAGIRADPQHPGFRHAIVRPYPVEGLTFVKASHKSLYGTLRSSWRRESGRFLLEVTVPANTTATVYLPAKAAAGITESGQAADHARGVKFVRFENSAAIYEVESGRYSFAAPL